MQVRVLLVLPNELQQLRPLATVQRALLQDASNFVLRGNPILLLNPLDQVLTALRRLHERGIHT